MSINFPSNQTNLASLNTTPTPAPSVASSSNPAAFGANGSSYLSTLQGDLQNNYDFFKNNLSSDGRVFSSNYGGSISEGQSYLMLQSVYENDPTTFAKTWQWTQQNMQRNDGMFAWSWGATGSNGSGSTGIIHSEFASDADENIAYALLQAGQKFNNPQYIQDAIPIIQNLWKEGVVQINGKPYLSAGDYSGFHGSQTTVDPSYLEPYVYREFAQYDPQNAAGWTALANDSYQVLDDSTKLTANGLPPNFVNIASNGSVVSTGSPGNDDFGMDAFRVFANMATDAELGSTQAQQFLQSHQYLTQQLQQNGSLPQGYNASGQALAPGPSGYTQAEAEAETDILNPSNSAQIYNKNIKPLINSDGSFMNSYDYYPNSTMWFALNAPFIASETIKPNASGTTTPAPAPAPAPTPVAVKPASAPAPSPVAAKPAAVIASPPPSTLAANLASTPVPTVFSTQANVVVPAAQAASPPPSDDSSGSISPILPLMLMMMSNSSNTSNSPNPFVVLALLLLLNENKSSTSTS